MGAVRVLLRLVLAVVAASLLTVSIAPTTPVASAAKAKKKSKKKAKKPCRGNRTEGYLGVCKAPKTSPQPPRPSVPLGVNGRDPDTYVDAAGTAHIVWNQDGGDTGPDVLRYCRLKRGSKSCDNPINTRSLVPVQNQEGNQPQFNEDLGGPRILAVGDDLAFITHRYPNVTQKPDGTANSRSTYLWVSDNGGNTITGGSLVGNQEASGGATVFTGPTGAPQIGLISDTNSEGTLFQAISPGNYTGQSALLGGIGRAYSGTLATVGGKPMTAFADTGGNTFIRRWTGAGSPANPGTWNQTQTSGFDPQLAAGPIGAFLATAPSSRDSLSIRKLNDIVPGKATKLKTGSLGARDMIVDPGGKLRVGWVDRTGTTSKLLERASSTGRTFNSERVLAQAAQGIDQVDLGSTNDGGGFGAYVAGGNGQGYGTILAAPFGTQLANNIPGIGNLPGGGADPNVATACERIAFRAVEILGGENGCFSGVPGQKGVKVSEGTLRLNGLEIIPDPGTKIRIDTKGKKTIDTVTASGAPGKVTVQIRVSGSSPIQLYRGALHLELPTGASGTKLATFAPGGVNIKGFPVTGSFDVILKQDSVEIPIEIGLPKSLLDITAGVTLRADNDRGLRVDSMHFRLPKVAIGPLNLADLDVSWTGSTDQWKGTAGLNLYAAAVRVAVEFDKGKFTDGSVKITPVPFPGVLLAPDTYLNSVDGRLRLTDNESFAEAGALFGVQPVSPPGTPNGTYVVTVRGSLRVNWRPKFLVTLGGKSFLGGEIPLAQAQVTADLDGNFTGSGQAQFNFPLVKGDGKFDAFIAAGTGKFAASIDAHVTVGTSPITVTVGTKAGFSNDEIFGCVSPVGGFKYTFANQDFTPYVFSCPGEPEVPSFVLDALRKDPALLKKFYEDRGIPQPTPNAVQGRAAQAATPGFDVPKGVSGVSVTAIGFNGAPGFRLVSPTGQTITPVPANAVPKGAPAVYTRTVFRTIVGLRKPAAGRWRILENTPGSIGTVNMARELPKPKVKIKVTGKGRKRTLRYTATARKGLAIKLFERMGKGGHQIGTITKRKGTIRFRVADGRGGRRAIEAHAEQRGLPVSQVKVGSYKAPAPARPARVRGLKVRRSGRSAVVRWRKVKGATTYLVRVKVTKGTKMRIVRLVSRRSFRVRRVPKSSVVSVSVTARNAKGRAGKAAKTKSKPKKAKSKKRKRK